MSHVYEGQPDSRQAENDIPVSRFRPRYRALSEVEKSIHDDVKEAFASVEMQIERIKSGRYRSLAMTALEEACMWAIKELTS